MSQVVEYLAELTGFRDRDVLDVTLVGALKDLLAPDEVAIYRCIGEGSEQRWITRARQRAGDLVATADPLWQDPASLPTVESEPVRHACMLRQEPMTIAGQPATSLFPLSADREGVGVLEITTARPLGADQMRLVSSILRVYRNFEALLDYSERDTLTGLLNRKTFDEAFLRMATAPADEAPRVEQSAEVARGAGNSAWLGVIDIDHFKRVNDGYGHLIGDEVLLLLSRLMRSSFRYQDRLYRFGGEEFVVLLRSSSHDAARLAFERLRSRVEAYAFPRVGQITISIGVTEVRQGDSPSSAFERADRAVYYAKQNGRNRVAHHADLVASGKLTEESHDGGVELF